MVQRLFMAVVTVVDPNASSIVQSSQGNCTTIVDDCSVVYCLYIFAALIGAAPEAATHRARSSGCRLQVPW